MKMPLSSMQEFTLRTILDPIFEELEKITDKSILKKSLQIIQTQELGFINAVALSNWKSSDGQYSILSTIMVGIAGIFSSRPNANQFASSFLDPATLYNLVRATEKDTYPEITKDEVAKYFKEQITIFIELQHLEAVEDVVLQPLTIDAIESYKSDIDSFLNIDQLKSAFKYHLNICDAVINRNLALISQIVEKEPLHLDLERFLINFPDNNGNTIFYRAVCLGNKRLIEYLIDKIDINQANNKGDTALMIAAQKGELELVEKLIELGADKEAKTAEGFTALMTAVHSGKLEIVEKLIELGADKEAKTAEGITALMDAAFNGKLEVVEKLIELGADKEAKTAIGFTSLMAAAYLGEHEIVKKLIELGADKEAQNAEGYTALMFAAFNGKLKIVEKLIELGADKEAQDAEGYTALMIAARYGELEIVEKLIELGADKDAQNSQSNQDNACVIEFFKAIDHNDIAAVKANLSLVNTANSDDNSAVFMATIYGHTQIAEFLWQQGAQAPEYHEEEMSVCNINCIADYVDPVQTIIPLWNDNVGHTLDAPHATYLAGLLAILMPEFHS
jgi:ankyrin repeat protein